MTATSRWRWRVRRIKGLDLVGEWRSSFEEAREDARAHGHAKWDQEFGWFMDVLTSLEQELASPLD